MPTGDKNGLREAMLTRRKALPRADITALSARILERIRELPAWADADAVLAYMPVKGEVDVRPLLDELWARGSKVLLPRCRPGEDGAMDLACPASAGDIRPGAFGIPEPDPDACPAEAGARPDLILAPGVAFDHRGFRLGYGGGYYDRLLAGPGMAEALVAAPAYGFQVVDALPDDPWDKPVHCVITEDETIWT